MEYSTEQVRAWGQGVLHAVGLDPTAAAIVIDTLLFADARGVASHGMLRLPTYVQRMRSGGIKVDGRPRVVKRSGATAVVDGDDAAGQISAVLAVETAAQLADRYGVASVWVTHGNHFGAAGYYGNWLAQRGYAAMVTCTTDAVMCAPGGAQPIVGTNPLCLAVPPDASGRVPMLDMATSVVAWGKLVIAAQSGDPIPPGWALDRDGIPTTDPTVGLHGSLAPVGGPKGFGLAFLIDAISGAVSGASTGPRIGAIGGDPAVPQRLSQLFVALQVGRVDPDGGYEERIGQLLDDVWSSPPARGATGRPMFPGEPEFRHAEDQGNVLALSTGTVTELDALANVLEYVPLSSLIPSGHAA